MFDSLFDNSDTFGSDAGPIRLFTFHWPGIGSRWSNEPLEYVHGIFNGAFARTFPKLLYTTPFTYYNGNGIGITSVMTGTAETRWNDAQIRAAIIAGATEANITGDPSRLTVSAYSVEEIENGAALQFPQTTVNPLATTDGANQAINEVWDVAKWPTATIAIAALAAVLLLRR